MKLEDPNNPQLCALIIPWVGVGTEHWLEKHLLPKHLKQLLESIKLKQNETKQKIIVQTMCTGQFLLSSLQPH